MHRIHVRTGVVDVPGLPPEIDHPTHDVFVIPTGPGEEVVEIDVLDHGWAPADYDPVTSKRLHTRRKRRWRFRAVSVEKIEDTLDTDIIVDYDDLDAEVDAKNITETTRRLLSGGTEGS
jgi:hypothetical protein